ncbi:MAG TPA: MarR family transcriptional regulator [Nocardioidaceae bacterium]|nr:MarR family transcriptional regulator [Nocardioidaceae bacterium]
MAAADGDGHDDAVLRFVEKFAMILVESGMPRMPARVFAYVLADDAERYTARELATGLRVSPAAISGAVRYLLQTGLVIKEREPGARSDHYRIYDDDIWYAIAQQRLPLLKRYEDILTEGVGMLDQARPGGRRVRETLEYMRFTRAEMADMAERWREHKQKVLDED